jgi:hypothetical protein
VLIKMARVEYSEVTTNIIVVFYSTYDHVHRMAQAGRGAESVPKAGARRAADEALITLKRPRL